MTREHIDIPCTACNCTPMTVIWANSTDVALRCESCGDDTQRIEAEDV